MKLTIGIIGLSIIASTTWAQNIRGAYQIKIGEQIKKQPVVSLHIETKGQDVLWNFSDMELQESSHTVKYTLAEPMSPDSIVVGSERGARFYYLSNQDSIVMCGYENRLTKVCYDRPELMLHMPLVYGERHDALFHGTASYCERSFLRVFGSSQIEVDGTGSMLLPTGDTLRHVSRVHLRKLTAQQHFLNIMTEKELRKYVDSIAPYSADSIREQLLADALLTETNNYRWYAAGYRYPIIECTTVGKLNEVPYHTEAFFCSPEEQEELNDDGNDIIRDTLHEIASSIGRGTDTNLFGSDYDNTPGLSALRHVAIRTNGSVVSINYEQTEDGSLQVMVCNIQGMVLRQKSHYGQSGNSYHMDIDCSGLDHGQHVIYLNVNGQVVSQTINI